jgi:hypothetical protein
VLGKYVEGFPARKLSNHSNLGEIESRVTVFFMPTPWVILHYASYGSFDGFLQASFQHYSLPSFLVVIRLKYNGLIMI